MRLNPIYAILFLPLTAIAQDPYSMNQADMEKMMQSMGKFQNCMQQVDQASLKNLEKRTKDFESEMKQLCKSGKRDQAQDKAISFAKEMMNSKDVKQLQKCSKMMQGMAESMPFQPDIKDYESRHVCDSLSEN